MLVFVFVCLVGLLGSSAQLVEEGQCNEDIALFQAFNIDNFLGSWYEVARTDNPQQAGSCARFIFERVDDVLTVRYEAVNRNFYEEATGVVTQEGDTARLTVNLDGSSEPVNFWILNTNHVTFASAYHCVNRGTTHRAIYVWQLGREQTFNELFLALINTSLNNLLGITLDDLYHNDFSDDACYELPIIEENQPVLLPGQCDPNIEVVQNLDVEGFAGLWHEISSYYTESAVGTCPRAEYTLEGSTVNVLNSQVVNQGLQTITGTASVISTDGSGKLSVVLEIAPGETVEQELWVIATDYTDYAVLYSCVNQENGEQKRVYSWITSRTRQQTPAAQAAVTDIVDSIMDLNAMYYEPADQSDNGCFYYPEVVPDQPVVFRGQCDMDIPAMPNFIIEQYWGLWHEIESYPSVFQTGTCNNALYLPNADDTGVVNVFNTQVINQRLDSISGNATVADDANGAGKLVVSFPVGDTDSITSMDYWVLDTDYYSYALVYTCYNIDADTRGVWSWKLSRSKQLTQAAILAIDDVISTIPVLDSRYFQIRDQSVDGCFYFPEAQPGTPVVFPGQCDENLAAQPNFILENFQGIWHEIEAYPNNEQPGECTNHIFTSVSGNTLDLQSSSIVDQFLSVTNGNIALDATDGSAKLVITMEVDNQVIVFPYWILQTDYVNYALAYTCINLDIDFRQIWSWKLSRSKTLSEASNTAIDAVIAPIQVLDNVYYDPVDQSDPACFFLPELEPGEPVVLVGQCQADIPVVQNFDPERYSGRWRLIESYPSDFQTGTCNDATYTLQGATVVVVNTQVVNEQLDTIEGSAVLATTNNDGKLIVTFPGADPVEYWILDTDYDSYALVYSCVNLNSDSRRVWSWKMSRTRELTENAETNINNIINGVDVLNNRYFQQVDNSDEGCFYFPIPDGNAVIFRGQCDENVNVVTNFDVARYLGTWYDLESYPQEFQNGTCATATYTLTDDGVEVYNTQVIGESLDDIHGLAVLDNNDGDAKLTVTFPIFGTEFTITSPYWVLGTDYENYAVVYSCVNLDEDSRRVTSWKLSRHKEFSASSVTAINAVIDNVQVLSDQYFTTRDHTEEGCFYFPEPVAGKPVVFPGQCDDTIQAQIDFDLERFSGIWHETAAYPKDPQQGQCVNYDFTPSSTDSFSLYTTQIIDLLLDETNATVVRTSTDNSARFTITIYDAGQNIEIPYWIISTDYENYALAYSCANIDAHFRGVWSWKLSRSKQMSTDSETAISQAMSNINVLDNQYFEDTSQSDEACFYLPVLGPNDPVIFPGPCDMNIPVVTNFSPQLYEGRWRLIESYQSDFQTGTCNDATYELQDDLSVLVVNTQVVNERLDTITGSAILATTDGTGKLLVTFPGADEPQDYWILATDYNLYSLVYSCQNINNEQRRVWSWKMSRTSALTDAANNVIDQIVNEINVLDAQYYQSIDQSDTGCFYFPVPDGNTVFFRGQCDENVAVVTNFDVARYTGLWYDIESYPQDFQNGTCATATYSLASEGVEVYNTQVINEQLDYIYGSAVPDNNEGLAKLLVTFPIAGTEIIAQSPYWVLATDYVNYALVYSCVNVDDDLRRVSSWKLSRQKTLAPESATAITAAMNSVQVLSQEYYENRDHTDEGCFYFPEPELGKPVVFPGQCDDSIPAVPNFDLNSFSGLWHEIEAYPKDQQEGQCVNYEFDASSDGTLDLYTTQVIGQLLDETNATAQMISTDLSARFLITINVDGNSIEIPYWIIATDYVNYALAYSCVNQGPNYRGVWSWKLSRSKQMPAASEAAINEAIAAIPVLDNQYYEPTSQTDESCFYLPVLTPEDPVVFVGQCDPNIPVIQDFDPTRYEGRWRLIESYASEFQTGTCNDATYTIQSDGSVLVYNTQVIDETLDTITGSATLATVDGSGKLLVTFPGAPEPVEYWILDTDYETFALVYSCVNLNSDQRRVWSWKLSRTTSLPDSASSTINEIVNSINVLDDQYYSAMDNSDTGCFYFPEPNGPVVFRGQCDETIQVVNNFDIARYMGTWYDIESYPQVFQDGTCATATYTLTDDGVLVYNTQVRDQLLDNVNATAVPVADDGLAKLIVTFPVAGTDLFVESPYWVLATDYDNYALVYSCSNINEEYRSVTSWKLSRTQDLSPASQASIDSASDNVQVLAQQYYSERGHTENDCFFYPENYGGPVVLDGQCQEQNAVEDFNINMFAGTWHETARFPSDEQTGECAANEFVISAGSFILTQTIVYGERLITVSGPASVSDDGRGIITATLQNDEGVSIDMTLYVLDTDYTEYAILFSCLDINEDSKQIYSWKLSRSRSGLSEAANNRIDEIVTHNVDLYEGYYEYTDQTYDGCFYYPVFEEPPAAIVLPGPCDDRIQAKANFDVNAYLGRWFEISKYPQRHQVGECSRAHYSEGSGDAPVDVMNTMVLSQILQTREGTAVLASTDGSGLLRVTFVLDDEEVAEANYYVLETDYENFALVYSCRNLDNGDSEAYSWKLSRQPTLSTEANNIINNVISNTRGLLEEYYQPTSQSDEDCFYVPEPNPEAAVVFRGQCEQLTGVAGFDMSAYVGWWHEIERYSSDVDEGECISSQFSSAGNGFQVVDTNVFDLTGQVATGTVTASADGRLLKTLSNGQVEEWWVLDTDYQTYSLLYSCSNLEDGEHRRVWSAKHSKTRSLSAAAQAAMDPIISANEVLHDQFYLAVDQSDSACFHYPEPTGQEVVLPGQCDENIAIGSFDPISHTGTWYLMEQYPDPEVSSSGTCAGARFSYNPETSLMTVLNWELGDEALNTVEFEGLVTGRRMVANLPIEGTNETMTRTFFFLHTDYVTYSVMYTCTNINQFQRSVVAYKFSRTRDLPDSAVTSINEYMETREELNQNYFNQIEHDDACIDPSSSLLVKSSLIVILVCLVLQMFM